MPGVPNLPSTGMRACWTSRMIDFSQVLLRGGLVRVKPRDVFFGSRGVQIR